MRARGFCVGEQPQTRALPCFWHVCVRTFPLATPLGNQDDRRHIVTIPVLPDSKPIDGIPDSLVRYLILVWPAEAKGTLACRHRTSMLIGPVDSFGSNSRAAPTGRRSNVLEGG